MSQPDLNELSSLQTQITSELAEQQKLYKELGKRWSAQLRLGSNEVALLNERRNIQKQILAAQQKLLGIDIERRKILDSHNDKLKEQSKIVSEKLLGGGLSKLTDFVKKIPLVGDMLSDSLNASFTGKNGVLRNVQASFIKSKRAGASTFKAIGRAGVVAFRGIAAAIAATGIGAIVIAVAAIVAALAVALTFFNKNEKRVQAIRKELGTTKEESRKINMLLHTNTELREQQLEAVAAMSNELGFVPKITKQIADDSETMIRNFKLSAEEAGALLAFNLATHQTLDSYNKTLKKVVSAENAKNKIQLQGPAITRELIKLSSGVLMQYKGQTAELIKQVATAKRLGINFNEARQIALGFLDIESSLEAQYELEGLTNRSFELDKVRALALNDPASAVEEMVKQFGPFLANANIIEQEAFARASNTTFDMVSKAVEMQTIAAESGSAEVAAELKNLQTPQEKMNEQLGKILDSIVKKLIPVVENMANFLVNNKLSTFFRGKKDIKASEPEDYSLDNAEIHHDFIIRPGQKPIKFNKDDLVMGGTSLLPETNNSSKTDKLLEELILAVRQSSTIHLNGDKVNETLTTRSMPQGLT